MSTPKKASIAELRAKRLKRLRNLANLSREEMSEGSTINVHTLIAWENARFGGLTLSGAQKVIERVTKEGVHTSEAWLMEGTGQEPAVNPVQIPHEEISDDADEEMIIAYELAIFKSKNKEAVSLRVNDAGMLPQFRQGDYVAGKKKLGKKILDALGQDCIVETTDGKVFFRNLRAGKTANTFTLVCQNPLFKEKTAIIADVSLEYAAPILWHRRKE